MVLAIVSTALAGTKYRVVHAFGMGHDGGGLWGSLALDAKGNLYGTTSGGGTYGDGTVFELSPTSNGTWAETILHSFPSFSDDGGGPMSTPIVDSTGNLYATTEGGGGPYSYGTVFELRPGSGNWIETIIHRFNRGELGSPMGPLIMSASGKLYGIAHDPFELSPDDGRWNITLLHHFPSYKGDGLGAYQGVILDAAGNVYGVTEGGGTGKSDICIQTGCGTAYKLHRMSNRKWKETILHDFGTGDDMAIPGGLLQDGSGNFYGAADGGAQLQGVIYKLSRDSSGHWKTTIQYSFTGGVNGGGPNSSLIMDKAGNLYGVTAAGGTAQCGCGVVYKLAPRSSGNWKYTVLHRFSGADGAQPSASLTLDSKGNLYGTTATGGAGGAGVAFEITP